MSEAVPRNAAFFDVDKTLLPGSSLYLLARGLYQRGFYTWRDVARFAVGQIIFRVSGREGQRGMDAARETARAFVQGRRADELRPLAADLVVEVVGPRIYPGMRAKVEDHHRAGDRTFLVTAAPEEIAAVIAAYLGMEGALGTKAELVDGVFTGEILGPLLHGPAKLVAIQELAAREHLDLLQCSAYSDSINDLPLLQGVGKPVAVNPDRDLRAHARAKGWPIEDFRSRRQLLLVWTPLGTLALLAGFVLRRRRGRLASAFLGDFPR